MNAFRVSTTNKISKIFNKKVVVMNFHFSKNSSIIPEYLGLDGYLLPIIQISLLVTISIENS